MTWINTGLVMLCVSFSFVAARNSPEDSRLVPASLYFYWFVIGWLLRDVIGSLL